MNLIIPPPATGVFALTPYVCIVPRGSLPCSRYCQGVHVRCIKDRQQTKIYFCCSSQTSETRCLGRSKLGRRSLGDLTLGKCCFPQSEDLKHLHLVSNAGGTGTLHLLDWALNETPAPQAGMSFPVPTRTQQTPLPRRKINEPRQTSPLREDAANCSLQQTRSQSRSKAGTQETCLEHTRRSPSPEDVTGGSRNRTENGCRCFVQNTGIFA